MLGHFNLACAMLLRISALCLAQNLVKVGVGVATDQTASHADSQANFSHGCVFGLGLSRFNHVRSGRICKAWCKLRYDRRASQVRIQRQSILPDGAEYGVDVRDRGDP